MRLLAPLEAMYPNRCYDCLAPCSHDELLCPHCTIPTWHGAVVVVCGIAACAWMERAR